MRVISPEVEHHERSVVVQRPGERFCPFVADAVRTEKRTRVISMKAVHKYTRFLALRGARKTAAQP